MKLVVIDYNEECNSISLSNAEKNNYTTMENGELYFVKTKVNDKYYYVYNDANNIFILACSNCHGEVYDNMN